MADGDITDGAPDGTVPPTMPEADAPLLALPRDEVHLWLLDPGLWDAGALTARLRGWLSPDEAARMDRYVFPRHRWEYLATRALCRAALSRYAPVEPAAWRFRSNPWGRPEVAAPAHSWLRFNLSNAEGLLACLVARDREVGVDVEDTTRSVDTLATSAHVFSAAELAALRREAAGAHRARFFHYWTLKEAYIKARGMGLALPLRAFSFLPDEAPPRVRFDPSLGDEASRWCFARVDLDPGHRVAVAAKVARLTLHVVRVDLDALAHHVGLPRATSGV